MIERSEGRTARGGRLWQRQAGAGARKDDMDNTCELLINVVSDQQAKDADKPEPKGMGQVKMLEFHLA